LPNIEALRNHIRNNSTPTTGLNFKQLREALPEKSISMLENLESTGDIIIMRGLGTEAWKNCGLPKLGKASGVNGMKINDNGPGGGAARMKSVWWDHVKERGRAGKRVEDGMLCINCFEYWS
jgi:transcription initiation factor TFIIE subunit beta